MNTGRKGRINIGRKRECQDKDAMIILSIKDFEKEENLYIFF